MNLMREIQHLMETNRREQRGFEYTVPSPESYPYQWFWDSCFHAIILSYFNPERAKNELRSLVAAQFENGLLPHVIYWKKEKVLDVDWGSSGTSSLIQPPLIAYSVWRLYERDRDRAFLAEMYPALLRYYTYLLSRDPRHHHLIGIINPDESGEDNSPRFDEPLNLSPLHGFRENYNRRFKLFEQNRKCGFDGVLCMKNFFWVKDVAFQSYFIENLRVLAEIARVLGRRDNSDYLEKQAELVLDGMRTYMYEDGIFWTIMGPEHRKLKVKTWAMFAPLLAHAYTEEEADVLVQRHLENIEEFNSTFLLPTTAMNHTSFTAEESTWGEAWQHPNWRGPVWMSVNWFMRRGLLNYGYHDLAERIRHDSLTLLEKSGFREYYNPRTGEGLGAKQFTWGGLAIDMK